jgi:hypothetical protein
VTPLTVEVVRGVVFAIEGDSEPDKFFNATRPLSNYHLYNRALTETSPCGEGVLNVKFSRVVIAGNGCDTTLSPRSRAL